MRTPLTSSWRLWRSNKPFSLMFCACLSLNSHWHWALNKTYFQEIIKLGHGSHFCFHRRWKSDTSKYGSSFPTETYLIHVWQLLIWFNQKRLWQSNTSSHLLYEVPQQALHNTHTQRYFQTLLLSQFPMGFKKQLKNVQWVLCPPRLKLQPCVLIHYRIRIWQSNITATGSNK